MNAAAYIELIRSAYAAWNRGDEDGLLETMSEDIEVRPVLGDVVAADSFHGHAGVRYWHGTVTNALDDFQADVEEIVDAGAGRYVVRVRFSGKGKVSGAPVSLEAAHLIRMHDGLAGELTGFPTWSEGLRAAGIA